MADGRHAPANEPAASDEPADTVEPVLTTPEDVASAGRSCMAIVVLGVVIVALIAVWVIYRALGGE
jgi:hypothetical protein